MMLVVMEGKAYRPPALCNSYLPESPAQVEFCANRICVHIWSCIYKGFQFKYRLQHSETCWNLIGRSMIAPTPVLSPSSIFLSSSSHRVSVCTYVWKGRKDNATSQNSPGQESPPEFHERGVILLCAYSFCHLHCGAEFKSLFYWHFGVTINFIGSAVSILLYAQLTWEQLFPTATGRSAWYQLLWFNVAVIMISILGELGGGLAFSLDSRKSVKPNNDKRFVFFFSKMGNLPSSKPLATGPSFHLYYSLDTNITHFPNKFFKLCPSTHSVIFEETPLRRGFGIGIFMYLIRVRDVIRPSHLCVILRR